jgi:phosphoglycolate phosphatase-like HAD superfamily hydrolase
MRMHIVLFDIDGTLIWTAGAGQAALAATLEDEFGVRELQGSVSYAGRTDRAIVSDLFRLHAIQDSAEHWQQFLAGYPARLRERLPTHAGRVLPGVRGLLDMFAAREDVALGLLTGNVRHGARLKLEHYGLADHFHFGAYGDCHTQREHVAHEALASARAHLGRRADEARVYVIGDTPHDVRCGRAIGATVIAVATGPQQLDVLAVAQPDLLLLDLSDPAPLLQLMETLP